MRLLWARFAEICFWGSVCFFAYPGASAVAVQVTTPPEISTIQHDSLHAVQPTDANTPEQQQIIKLMRPGRKIRIRFDSDLRSLA
jgi:hypothetical protein